jgi:hypothetical protein
MNVLNPHAFKNKTPFQLDLFAAATAEQSAPEPLTPAAAPPIVPAADPLIGQAVRLPNDLCKCGSDIAVIRAGKGPHHARLQCRSCGRFRGWVCKFTADWIASVAAKFGAPEIITIKAPYL